MSVNFTSVIFSQPVCWTAGRPHGMSLQVRATCVCCDRCCSVRIRDLHDLHQVHDIVKLDNDLLVSRCEWTDDGQLVGVSSPCGSLYVFLTQLPIIGASYMTRIAYLSSLHEITLHDADLPVSPLKPNFLMQPPNSLYN